MLFYYFVMLQSCLIFGWSSSFQQVFISCYFQHIKLYFFLSRIYYSSRHFEVPPDRYLYLPYGMIRSIITRSVEFEFGLQQKNETEILKMTIEAAPSIAIKLPTRWILLSNEEDCSVAFEVVGNSRCDDTIVRATNPRKRKRVDLNIGFIVTFSI